MVALLFEFIPKIPNRQQKQAIKDIRYDKGLKAAIKFDQNLATCRNSTSLWWVSAVGGKVGALLTNGLCRGWGWPANYKEGSSNGIPHGIWHRR